MRTVDLARQAFEHGDLVGHLCAAHDGGERAARLVERLSEHGQLLRHEEAGSRGQQARDALGGGVGPVGRAERVVDVEVRWHGECRCELHVVGLFTLVESQVLEHRDLRGPQGVHGVQDFWPNAVSQLADGRAKQLGQPRRYGGHAQLFRHAPSRSAQVRADYQLASTLAQIPKRGQRRRYAAVVRDLGSTGAKRHVVVDAHQYGAAVDPDVRYRLLSGQGKLLMGGGGFAASAVQLV